MNHAEIVKTLGEEANSLLTHACDRIPKEYITSPSPDHVEMVFADSDRSVAVQANLKRLYGHGRLGNTGYLSIFPVDQGIEHTAGFSFAQNLLYFDPETIVQTAIQAGCSGVTSTLGVFGLHAKQFADQIPFILKLNHNELLTYPNKHDQIMFSSVQQAFELGAAGVGATIYFGSPESNRQILEVSKAFHEAHRLGMFTILWCYPRNNQFESADGDFNAAFDISSQAIHLGVTIEADIIKQKLPNALAGFKELKFAKSSEKMYELVTDHPIDLVRYQVLNSYAGKIDVLNSGGESLGEDDWRDAIRTAVINKRAGGAGVIMGRKVFKRSLEEGIALLQAVQDVYLDQEITLA